MNKYIEKIAKELSEENKAVAKTFALQTAAGVPAHALGIAGGGYIGHKLIEPRAAGFAKKFPRTGKAMGLASKGGGKAIGVATGMMAMGALSDIASLKHSLRGKVKENK